MVARQVKDKPLPQVLYLPKSSSASSLASPLGVLFYFVINEGEEKVVMV